MKLLVTIVQDQDSVKLAEELVANNFRSTKLASTGGFLNAGNTTLLIGVADNQVEDVLTVVKSVCHTREKLIFPVSHSEAMAGLAASPVSVQIGGAVVFVLNVDQFCQLTKPNSTVCEK